MNKEFTREIINLFLQEINCEGVEELEEYIGTTLSEFLTNMLFDIYDEYKNVFPYLSCKDDKTTDYILKSENGMYSLESFLINRLIKNISSIQFIKQYFAPDSHFDPDSREIVFDADRFRGLNNDQRKKVVYHEFLHALKTDYIDSQFFQYRQYFDLKEKIKQVYPGKTNDFTLKDELEEGIYSVSRHTGICYRRGSEKYVKNKIDENIDEILNESESIKISNDNNMYLLSIRNSNQKMLVHNGESSNCAITNYGFLLKTLLSTKILFKGQYLEPDYLVESFNMLYSDIFRNEYNMSDDSTAWDIFSNEINKIKKDNSEELHKKLLETIYKCIIYKNKLLNDGGYDLKLNNDIKELREFGLCEMKENGRYGVSNILGYYNDIMGKELDAKNGRSK